MNRNNKCNPCLLKDVMAVRYAVELKAFVQQQCTYIVERCSLWVVSEAIESLRFRIASEVAWRIILA